jgi:putative oxidoreductase
MPSSSLLTPPDAPQQKGGKIMDSTRYLAFAGRLLIGLPLAMSGLGKLAAYGPTTAMIAAAGLPVPPLAFAVAVALELGGGLLLIAGYQARPVAIALAVFCFATAISFHSNFPDKNQIIHFLKNVMMAGGLLQIAAFGAGGLSLDNRFSKDREAAAKAVPAH